MNGSTSLRSLYLVFSALTIAVFAACSSGGFLEPPRASGTIVANVVGGQTDLQTKKTMPYLVTGGFAISLSETGYTAQFGATITSFTAPTVGPCFSVAMNAAGNVATFTPLNATALTGSSATDPCLIPFSDVETVTFTDQNGHSSTQWFERTGTTGNPSTLSEFYFGPGASPIPSPVPSPTGSATAMPTSTIPPLSTTFSNPLPVDQGTNVPSSFSVLVLSSLSAGPFKAQSVYWTAATSASCLAISPASSTNGVFTFTLSTPPPTTGTGTSPCLTAGQDTEEIYFSDNLGNSNVQFFKL